MSIQHPDSSENPKEGITSSPDGILIVIDDADGPEGGAFAPLPPNLPLYPPGREPPAYLRKSQPPDSHGPPS